MAACSSHTHTYTHIHRECTSYFSLLFSQKCSFQQGVEAHLYSVKHQNSVGHKSSSCRAMDATSIFCVKSSYLAGSAFGSREEWLGSSRVSWLIMSSLIVEQCKSCWISADLINIHTGSSLKWTLTCNQGLHQTSAKSCIYICTSFTLLGWQEAIHSTIINIILFFPVEMLLRIMEIRWTWSFLCNICTCLWGTSFN